MVADAGVARPVVVRPGQQVAVVVPPGGDQLSGEAKDAYDRGFQAWISGDLSGAKAAFSEAVSKAPNAGGPRYSLGCVLERLGDSQAALDSYRAAFTSNSKYDIAMGAYARLMARTGHGSDAEQFLADKRGAAPDSPRLLTYTAEVKSIEGDPEKKGEQQR